MITRTDHTSAELRALSRKYSDGAQVRRLLALALVFDGHPRSAAAALNGMDRQTLRDWVHRYDAAGIEGLKSRRNRGRASTLTEQQKAELRELVVTGPDPAKDEVVRWRCADIRTIVARRFSAKVHVSTIGKWLNQFGLRRLQPRPYYPKKDVEAEAVFKKASPAWSERRSPKPRLQPR